MARFTKTVFIPNSEMAVTGTDIGYVIVWDRSLIIEGIGEQNEKRLIKIVALNELNSNLVGSEINILTTVHDKYLVCGNENGTIRFFDFYFKVVAWFSDCYLHNVKSISFSKTDPEPSQTNNEYSGDTDEVFSCSEFLVTDSNAMIAMLKSKLFEEIEPGKKKGQTIMHGIKSAISAIAVHPRLPILAIAGEAGFILLWDYIKKANTIENYDHFSKDEFTRVEFTTDGNEILVAQTNGEIRILET
jgi:WD40 repeat protein